MRLFSAPLLRLCVLISYDIHGPYILNVLTASLLTYFGYYTNMVVDEAEDDMQLVMAVGLAAGKEERISVKCRVLTA